MWQRNTWVVTTQISTIRNITEFYVAFTNRLIVIVIIAIITELMFVGFSKIPFSREERNVEFINTIYHNTVDATKNFFSLWKREMLKIFNRSNLS